MLKLTFLGHAKIFIWHYLLVEHFNALSIFFHDLQRETEGKTNNTMPLFSVPAQHTAVDMSWCLCLYSPSVLLMSTLTPILTPPITLSTSSPMVSVWGLCHFKITKTRSLDRYSLQSLINWFLYSYFWPPLGLAGYHQTHCYFGLV